MGLIHVTNIIFKFEMQQQGRPLLENLKIIWP
jgi:hypothetical protein